MPELHNCVKYIFSIPDWRENADIYFVAPKPSVLKDEDAFAAHEALGYKCPDSENPNDFLRQLETQDENVLDEFFLQFTGDLTVRIILLIDIEHNRSGEGTLMCKCYV